MVEDAKALEDGPAFEPTKRLRGLAAVRGFSGTIVEALAMGGDTKDVSDRGQLPIPLTCHISVSDGVASGVLENTRGSI